MDESSSTAMVGGDNNELLLPLKEWVDLSKLAEQQQQSSVLPSPENLRNAQLDYVARAVAVAVVVLGKLLALEENNYDWCPRHISIDNIHLEMGAGDVSILRRRETTIDLTSLQNIQDVELLIPQNISSNGGVSSDEIFKNVGLILYYVFSRGEVPPSSAEQSENNNIAEETMSNARGEMRRRGDESLDDSSQDESDSYEEKAGPNKGRQKVSIQEATKTFRGMSISNVEDALSQKGLSPAICRLIADLIIAPEDVDTNFQSLSEAVAEIRQIMRIPEICFGRDTDSNNSTTNLLSLRFGDGIVGRTDEVGMLLQASARAQMDTESSHICLIGGMAGVGKSYLVDSVKDALMSNGWIYLSCKFDRLMRNQPLVTIASAMESFIQQLINERGLPDGFDADAVVAAIEQSLSASGIVVLSDLVPSLRVLYRPIFAHVIMDDSEEELNYVATETTHDDDDDDVLYEDGISSANTLRNRLHYLFGRLIEAISSVEHPILLFLDDLQWADASSLELLLSLLISWDHDDDTTQRFLIAGAFRSNEVDEAHILRRYIQQFETTRSVSVTNIQLDGITKYGTHVLVSEALLLPLRLTRGLADIVYAKSLGNPLFVKSLLRQLVDENILRYSLSKKRWVWDINDVKSVSVDDNVAELMKHKLLRLPNEVQNALKLISCFGIQVSNDIISMLCTSSESSSEAIITYLEQAQEEHILGHNDQVYKFAHDMLQQSAYDLMSPEEKGACHFRIGLHLMSSLSKEASYDELLFTVVDQINNAKLFGATDVSMDVSFAELNLQAGKRSMEVSDFESAWQYVVFGISYLPEAKWGPSTYELALGLHEAGALACFVNVDTKNLQLSLGEIFENAARFEDKIKAYYILAQNLASLNRANESMATVRFVLNELGEDIPEEVSPDDVEAAMMSTQQLLDGYSKEDIVGVPRLKDEKKQWAVKLMEFSLACAFMLSPRLLPILANRIINILVKDGACKESAFGFSAHSLCLIIIRRDIEAGYSCSKMAIALLESFDAPGSLHRIKTTLQNFVTFLVEPIQSTANVLLESYEGLRATGDNEYACLALNMYVSQSIMLGCSLPVIEIECEEFALRSLRLHQLQYCRNMSSTHNMILALTGNEEAKNPFNLLRDHGISTEDDLLQESLSSGRSGLSLHIYFSRLFAAFWLKKYTEAAEFAAQYRKLGRFSMRFIDIYHALYEGLTAFHLARCSTDKAIKTEWMGVGENSVDRFKVWQEHSTWNFENKLFLLEAECHRCTGEDDVADSKYLAAIESAQRHRFLHEEGLAAELYASFLAERGESDSSKTHLLRATACYEKWGASAVVNLLKSPE